MDKLKPEEVLDFLGRNQRRFEELYEDYGFIVFITGHKPWVNQIHETTEYSFFQGPIFRILPIVDVKDVEKLITSRLLTYAHMNQGDIPFTEESYLKIRELTKGVPRNIIRLAEQIINEAYNKKIPTVGPGFIEEMITQRKFREKLIEYLQNNYETYDKLSKVIRENLLDMVLVFYTFSPSHEIPKTPYDKDVAERTRFLGLELTNDEWQRKIEKLLRYECIEDRGTKRALSRDISDFLDIVQNVSPIDMSKIIPSLIRDLKNVIRYEEKIRELTSEDFFEAIERAFKIRQNDWLTKKEILTYFKDTTAVSIYIKSKFREYNFEEVAEKLFTKYFRRYLRQFSDNIMIFRKGRQIFYRKLPKNLPRNEYEVLRQVGRREIIDKYIDLIKAKGEYDDKTIIEIDKLIEELTCNLGRKVNLDIDPGFLRKKSRHYIFKLLKVPINIRRLVNSYISLSKETPYNTEVIRNVAKHIIIELSKIISKAKPFDDYELLKRLEEELRCFIEESLSKITKKWWFQRIPNDVRINAEKRMKKEEKLWPWIKPKKKTSPIHYVNFSEYCKIIERKDNWREVFKDVFKDIDIIKGKLTELENIRNKVMHFRPLTPNERAKLKLYTSEIIHCIKEVKENN